MDEPWVIIALLGAVVFIFAFIQSRSTKSVSEQPEVVREMEETFEQFAKELEEDNRQLMSHLSELKGQYELQNRGLQERIDKLEGELRKVELPISQPAPRVIISRLKSPGTVNTTSPEVSSSSPDSPTTSRTSQQQEAPQQEEVSSARISERYHQIFELYGQGKSIEYIAKKMEMNKGEVQLILTLAEQEEALRVQK